MSTVQDEAEIGPVETSSETEDDSVHNEETTINHSGLNEIETDAERHRSSGWEEAGDEGRDGVEESLRLNGETTGDSDKSVKSNKGAIGDSGDAVASKAQEKLSSADSSLSAPDDTPSVQNSLVSSRAGRLGLSSHGQSPTPSLRPFDQRFQARLLPSPLNTPRAASPSFLTAHSRQSSTTSQLLQASDGADTPDSPWEVIRWTKLRKITGQAFSETGKRNFGRPTCIAISSSIALGTSRGIILIFDYHQNLKVIIGPGTKAAECGAITSIALSADHSTVAGGHAAGNIFTWEIAKPAKPFLYIASIDRSRVRGFESDGHVSGAAILHLGFLGTRHTALVSADDKGMAFSHLATRGMGLVTRSIRTTRILGRYPDITPNVPLPKKPSSVLAFSPLPLGVTEHSADSMGLVAILTPYLLVIVSTTPVAQTQHKATKPKDIAVHGAMSAALAWYPAVQAVEGDTIHSESSSKIKLAYCWSNVLMLLDVMDTDVSGMNDKDKPPDLQFKPRKRWKAEEAIVAIQWLGRSVLAVMTITQQLIILEDTSLHVTDSFDLIKKHVYHADLFSQQLSQLIERLDEEDISMHGVVADAFYMSFRAYKGRLFLLGFNDVSIGTLSNWADRLLALMERGDFIGAIKLATSYYDGEVDIATIGLPEDSTSRHALVREKLLEMMSASLRYAFGKNPEAGTTRLPEFQLKELAAACFSACNSIRDMDFLFEDVYAWYSDGEFQGILLEIMEPPIREGRMKVLPPSVIKDLISHFVERQWDARLEELLCDLDPSTMDIDQITTLCKANRLYDALLYVWNQALGDFTTVLKDLVSMHEDQQAKGAVDDHDNRSICFDPASKIFPYLSYTLTSRIYPTGDQMQDDKATIAKAEIYSFLFCGSNSKANGIRKAPITDSSYPNLDSILHLDAPSFLSVMNEAFEDSFLNDSEESGREKGAVTTLTTDQRFGLALNRQYIVSILLEVMTPSRYGREDIVYMNMFVARNLPKFPQYILLPGSVLHRILVDLCNYSNEDIQDDCQLSVEYLLSVYQPPDLPSLIPLFSRARFYRVMKSIYKAENQYDLLLQTCFEDHDDPEAVFGCIAGCLKPGAGLNDGQLQSVCDVVAEHAREMVSIDLPRAASTIQQYAPDLHSVLLGAIGDNEHAQFQYLQTIFEPQEVGGIPQYQKTDTRFVEQYVRLLCEFDPHHVSHYIKRLKVSDLRLEEVLPALESSGVIDAAVVLLTREGKIREALDRLIQYLRTLEAALIGLLDGADSAPDPGNTQETANDLVESFDKYVRIGIWLCQGQSKSVDNSRVPVKHLNNKSSSEEDLSADEVFWVDLVDAVVQVTRNVSEVLDTQYRPNWIEHPSKTQKSSETQKLDTSKLPSLRNTVQDTFTALLVATSIPPTNEQRHRNMAFLRILRAFLNRASLSSPSLSNLRAVLAAVFSAYSYEESLLDLANRLLDKDLFVRVSEVTVRRKRGWRPLGQFCEGCGRKVWGPGAGRGIWDAWVERGLKAIGTGDIVDPAVPRSESSKGKDVAKLDGKNVDSKAVVADGMHDGPVSEESSPLIVFSCRHIFHQICLKGMQTTPKDGDGETRPSRPGYSCPLCK